jgi:predicted nucleic acid-binding protein
VTTWLIDKSAIVRLGQAADPDRWADRIGRGQMHISTVTRLEIGYSARTGQDHAEMLRDSPLAAMPVEHLTPRMEDRAVEVQAMLAARGHHRAPSVPDLLLAATAELAGLTVLHLDKDFELIAELTAQPLERLVLA